ncbi:Na+/H+ antiporter [Pseudoflavitalea sp. X16]|uniref:Na+/H+ antiporter n=1 Tax=Paraflavitalea devenefica TaxID=2716334 RepID=UPI001420130F|nr:Na+/H+ antiporter [Paraflavitalea devenefica]NII24446.1 Na+/H+ antiporter [Paraflavitalea devenefica]
MLQNNLLLIISLLFVVSMLSMLSDKLRISYPILLVIAGLLIGFIPGVPAIKLEPDLVFIIFLPPLLYAAAWNTSWNDFWRHRRPIGLLAFGLVVFTATAIAFISNALIPGFTLSLGFLLGGIISPPDAIAATSVLQQLKVPKRITTILEGESLINDASSLIVFRFALAAISTGHFVLWEAGVDFLLVAVMGIVIGLAIAHIVYAIHRWLPTTPSIDTAITLISPYLMYIAAEHFHFSGVLAVVSGGLFLSFRSHEVFSYNTRIQAVSVWETLVFLLNGVVFIMIGLELPYIINELEDNSLLSAIWHAVIISLATIVIRIIWVFPGAYLPRVLSKRIRENETRPNWKSVFITGWSGMRGVVSLASALAVPITLAKDQAFPYRNLILFITFVVILFTLVIQGLSLPWLIRVLKIEAPESEAHHEHAIRLRMANAVLDMLEKSYREESSTIEAFVRLKERYTRMAEIANSRLQQDEKAQLSGSFIPQYRKMLLEAVEVRRAELQKMTRHKEFPDELLRKREAELDLEEARLRK